MDSIASNILWPLFVFHQLGAVLRRFAKGDAIWRLREHVPRPRSRGSHDVDAPPTLMAEHERQDFRISHGIAASLDEIEPGHVRHQISNQTRPGTDVKEVTDIALPPRALASSELGISSSRASQTGLVRHLPSARSLTTEFSKTIPCEPQLSPAPNRDKRTSAQQPIRPPSSATRRRSIIMPTSVEADAG